MQALIGSLPSVLGLASGVIVFLIAVIEGLMRAPDLMTPATYQTEQTMAHPVGVGEFEPDLAWPFYPFRQARADLTRVRARPERPVREACQVAAGRVLPRQARQPLLVVVLLSDPGGHAELAAHDGPDRPGLLRGLRRGQPGVRVARRHGTRCSVRAGPGDGEGPACPRTRGGVLPQVLSRHPVAGLPVPRLRELAPGHPAGQAGPGHAPLRVRDAAAHHAAAGQLATAGHLPARPVRAAAPRGAGALRDIRIAIFGDTSAGKTRFLYAGAEQPDADHRSGPVADRAFRTRNREGRWSSGLRRDPFRAGHGKDLDRRAVRAHLPAGHRTAVRAGPPVRRRRGAFPGRAAARRAPFPRTTATGSSTSWTRSRSPRCQIAWPGTTPRRSGSRTPRPATRRAPTTRSCPGCGTAVCRRTGNGWPSIVSKADLLRATGLELPAGSAAIAEWLHRGGYAQPRDRRPARLRGGPVTSRSRRRPVTGTDGGTTRCPAALAAARLRHAAARPGRCG